MRHLLPTLTSLLTLLTAMGCQQTENGSVIHVQQISGSEKSAQETHPLDPFTAIDISVGGRLEIVQGDTDSISIEADENVLPHLEAIIEDDTLCLQWKISERLASHNNGSHSISIEQTDQNTVITTNGKTYVAPSSGNIHVNNDQVFLDDRPVVPDLENNSATVITPTLPIIFRLAVTDLSKITSHASTEIHCDHLETPQLELTNNGSGKVSFLQLNADSITVHVAGSGDVSLAGQATNQNIQSDGSGTVEATGLASTTAKVTVSGSGDVHVHATLSLLVELLGSGNVTYSGSPELEVSANGSGKISKGPPT